MRTLLLLCLAWPSLALALPPGPLLLGQVDPKAVFPGRLVRILDGETIVTLDEGWYLTPSNYRRTLKYWHLELGLIDSLDLLPIDRDIQYSRLALSPDEKLLALILDDSVNVRILRIETGEIVSSFKDVEANPDLHIEFWDDGLTVALNNQNNGVNLWEVATGLPDAIEPDTSISISDAVSPDGSTYAYTYAWGANLLDREGRWKVRLNTYYSFSHLGRIEYFPDGLFLAASQTSWRDSTWVWDLAPFPPNTPIVGEAVVVDSLRDPIEGLEINFGHGRNGYFFNAITDEEGRIPLIVPRDGYYYVDTFYRWGRSGGGMGALRTRWMNVPLEKDVPFTLKLFMVGGVRDPFYGHSVDTTRPWEIIGGRRVNRVEVQLQVSGFEDWWPPGAARGMIMKMFRSGYGRKPPHIWEARLDSSGRTSLMIASLESINGLYQIQMHDGYGHGPLAAWHSIPINRGRRHAFHLPIGGPPVGKAVASPDFDEDGEVGFSDFFLFAEHFGGSAPRFDLDGSGSVDFKDFFLFAEHFGQPAPSCE